MWIVRLHSTFHLGQLNTADIFTYVPHHIRGFASLHSHFLDFSSDCTVCRIISRSTNASYKSYKRLTVIRSLPSASALFYYYGSTASSFIYGHVFWSY